MASTQISNFAMLYFFYLLICFSFVFVLCLINWIVYFNYFIIMLEKPILGVMSITALRMDAPLRGNYNELEVVDDAELRNKLI